MIAPTLTFQGRHDASVGPKTVHAFARARPNVMLTLLADDHQLTASLPRVRNDTADVLRLAA